MSNPSQHSYRLSDPAVFSFAPSTASAVIGSLKGLQIPEQKVDTFGTGTTSGMILRETRIGNRDVNPGQSVDGVLCFKQTEDKPQIYRFVFANDESHPVSAAAVL